MSFRVELLLDSGRVTARMSQVPRVGEIIVLAPGVGRENEARELRVSDVRHLLYDMPAGFGAEIVEVVLERVP